MAKKKSKKSPYHSLYSESYVSAAQYIAELVCQAKSRCIKTDLPTNFWMLPEWAKLIRYQNVIANRLLSEFTAEELITALTKDKRLKRIWSLNAKWVRPILEEYKGKFVDQNLEKELPILPSEPVVQQPIKISKSIIGKIADAQS